ncbi:nuclear mRNA export, poly(A)+RNA binding protein [Tulasnella sp. 419]|nr:nuclear mRNA export, poly(A)+RNA binding protein [Tulasnella sp. 418]KAG8956421.1 nuclear mRNA export, poly(A)+RNA binding protein [Tulasnella sp. 419]
MFTTTPALPSTPASSSKTPSGRAVASAALRNAGLIDSGDTKMNVDKTVGAHRTNTERKQKPRARIYERPKIAEKDNTSGPHPLASRLAKGATSSLSIRGVSAGNKATSGSRPSRGTPPERGGRTGASSSQPPPTKGHNIQVIREFLQSRYDPQSRFLNLENLEQDPVWKKNGLKSPDSENAPRDIGAVILKLASRLEPPPETISFASNKFTSLALISHLHHYLPNLHNLSLQNNQLKTSKELAYIAGKGGQTSNLRELILLGNPFRDSAQRHDNIENYRSDVIKRFPNLVMLDKEPITKIGFDISTENAQSSDVGIVQAPTTFPVGMGPAILGGDISPMTAAFLTKFFTLFDTDRPSLISAYAPNATFSWSINTSVPPRARIKGYFRSMPNQSKLEWTNWLPGSRNLIRLRNLEKETMTLKATDADIIDIFKKIPETKHTISEAENFVVDAWPIDGVLGEGPAGVTLFVTIHGQFAEMPVNGFRSFDRSFVLAPATEGSRAQQNGWPCVVLSDQLVVRNFAGNEAWVPGPLTVQTDPDAKRASTPGPQAAPPSDTKPQAPINEFLANIPEPQRSLVVQLQAQTGLNSNFAFQCMEGNGWDMNRALANFQELRPTIPPEAFVQ